VPVEFWSWVIPQIKALQPNLIFIAEIYQPHQYHNYIQQGRFDFLYDKVGLYDSLRRLMTGGGHTAEITHCWSQETRGIAANMLRFLENHDEQRIASEHFAGNAWAAIPAMTVAATLSTGPVLIYFGQEVGEPALGSGGFQRTDGRTTIFDYWGVPEHQKWMNGGLFDGGKLSPEQVKLRQSYAKLLNLLNQQEALNAGNFYQLQVQANHGPKNKIYAYLRFTAQQKLLIVVNFDRHAHHPVTIPFSQTEQQWLLGKHENILLQDILEISPAITPHLKNDASKATISLDLPPLSAYIFLWMGGHS